MSALLIGLALVIGAAALFGLALFGRRPVPQPAITGGPPLRAPEVDPQVPAARRREVERIHLRAADVRPSFARRLRAAGLLTVGIVGASLLIGAVMSILFVGAVLFIA